MTLNKRRHRILELLREQKKGSVTDLAEAFDVTPARLVTALVTERGVCPASAEGLLGLYPERRG